MTPFARPPIGICIHHSLTRDGKTVDTAAIRRFHTSPALNGVIISMEDYRKHKAAGVDGLKAPWDDIGYHALIERVDGVVKVLPGRSERMQGAHCPPLNATHLGLCIVGNFDLAAPDDDLLQVAASWCRGQMQRYNMQLRNITYHCDHSSKTCPGSQFPKAGFLLDLAGERRP